MSDAAAQIERLSQENAELRGKLAKIHQDRERAAKAKWQTLKIGWSLLFPLFDRRRLVRSGLQLFTTLSGLTGPRESWPEREAILADAREFVLSILRFGIRRRMLMALLGLTAFVIPGIQIWLAVKQNEIIENQNKFFEIEVFDTTAQGLTSGTLSSRQVTGSLLAKVDLQLLQNMSEGVFQSYLGASLTEDDGDARVRLLQAAAFRSYFVNAITRQIVERGDGMSAAELDRAAFPMFRAVMWDAANRLPDLFRISGEEARASGAISVEVAEYVSSVVGLLKDYFRLAHTVGEQARFYETVRPLFERATGAARADAPFSEIFFGGGRMEELLALYLAAPTSLGKPVPAVAPDQLGAAKRRGFDALKTGLGKARVNWTRFQQLADVP